MTKNRRRILLVNRPFQFRFAFYVCSWVFSLTALFPIVIANLFDYILQYAATDPNGPSVQLLRATRGEILWLTVFLEVSFMLIIFLISIFMSHRIAGPLYKLSMFMQKAARGDISQDVTFRKNDHFQNLAEDYNSMLHAFREVLAKKESKTRMLLDDIQKIQATTSDSTTKNALADLLAKNQVS